MRATIRRVRLSFFWSRRFSVLVGGAPPAGAPMSFLARRVDYKRVFETLRRRPDAAIAATNAGPRLELPWPEGGTNRFWRCYLAPRELADVSGGVAWSRLIPLRRNATPAPTIPKLSASGAAARVEAEALFHAHATTFALHLTVTAEKPLPLNTMTRACVELRNDKVFAEDGGAPIRADDLAARWLARLCGEALGPAADSADASQAFTLATVIQGDGVDPSKNVDASVHRALEGLTGWSPTWDANLLPPLQANLVPSRRAPPGHVIYGHTRARAVWEPTFFLPSRDGSASLRCYHRNLFAGAVQTEALLGFARLTLDAADAGHLSPMQNEIARTVVEQLLAIHAGDRTRGVYRSDSLRVQIDQHPWRAAIDALAQRLWMERRLPSVP